MGNKYVYISFPAGGGEAEDISVFETAEAAWLDYESSSDGYRELTRHEFIEAIEETEAIVEFGTIWFRDTLVTEP
jgi:hypothetical protein